VRGQQQIFETAEWYDYAIAVVVTFPLAAIAGALVTALGFFSIILAPVAGGAIAEIVRFAVRRRRGRYLSLIAAGAFALGGLLLVLWPLGLAVFALFTSEGRGIPSLLINALWPVIYAALGAGTVYARLRGISIQ
jgi:MFS family permease